MYKSPEKELAPKTQTTSTSRALPKMDPQGSRGVGGGCGRQRCRLRGANRGE